MAQQRMAYGWASQQAPEFQADDVIKVQPKWDFKSRLVTPTSMFVIGGSFLLFMLAVTPVWNAVSLLQDFNYTFWSGHHVPHCIIITCASIILLYIAISSVFFGRTQASAQTEQMIMNMATIFITLFGVALMLASLPLTWEANLTSTNLLHNCDASAQTHRLYEYSQVLQNIRATPECAKKFSVEECAGYQDSPPYTNYLKQMESSFMCAGFCYRPSSAPAAKAALLGVESRHVRTHTVTALTLATDAAEVRTVNVEVAQSDLGASATYPPTLFSDANFQASCEGMASRDMQSFAGDVGSQMFFQGIYLVLIAVATGFLKLMGLCVRKE